MLPAALRRAVQQPWQRGVEALIDCDRLIVVSRGLGLAVAMEAALKFTEVCGIQAEAFSEWQTQSYLMTRSQAKAQTMLQDAPKFIWKAFSSAVQRLTEGAGFSVVRSLVGHGVGRSYHEDPQIPNYGPPGRGPLLQEGMTLAIEPMITAGEPEVYVHADEWSISSVDESLAAHFEHTVAITAEGPRVLTTAKAALLR